MATKTKNTNNNRVLKRKQIEHYYQNTRLTFKEIADKVGLKSPQAVNWYITYYKIEKKPVKEYVVR